MQDVELGGRKFNVITNGTIEHDYWMHDQIRKAGVDKLNMEPGQTAAAFVDQLLAAVTESGQAIVLLGGMLTPEGIEPTEWTPDVAKENTTFINKLTEQSDKVAVRGLVALVLAGFFQNGLASLTTSLMSSTTNGTAQVEPIANGGA